MCVYGVSVGSFTYKELWRLSMGNFRWVEWTDPGIWSCGWRSWFTSNPQCGPGQPTKHVWVSVCLSRKGRGWNGKSLVTQSRYFTGHEESSPGGHSGSISVSVCASSVVPAPVSALPAEGLGSEWRGNPSCVPGRQLCLSSGRSYCVWMGPPAWPGNLGVLFPWYLKELFVLCPRMPMNACRAVWPHSGQYFPNGQYFYNRSCTCVLDMHIFF